MRFAVLAAACVALCVALLGCPLPDAPPGDVHMGQYVLTAAPVERLEDGGAKKDFVLPDGGPKPSEDGGIGQCELIDLTGNDFTFDAILTRESTSEKAWVTLNTYSREGTFDGQVLTSTTEANRVFEACPKCRTHLVETLSVAVLSRSQSEAAGQCPENALDGGVIVDLDAGIVPPGETMMGYDGARLCGVLVTTVVAEEDGGVCPARCSGCSVRYTLRGDRR